MASRGVRHPEERDPRSQSIHGHASWVGLSNSWRRASCSSSHHEAGFSRAQIQPIRQSDSPFPSSSTMSTPVDNKADDLSPTELATLRRKKNADAQAAFRSRRANYIANLEETVTRLEFVVRQLQNNCREARDMLEETKQENMELRATINSMRQAERERERVWRALNNRGNPQATLSDASSDTDGSLVTANCQQQLGMVQMDNSLIDYQGRGLTYPQPGELSVHQLPSPADTMNALPSYDAYANQNIMLSGANYPLFNDNHHDGSAQWNTSMGGGNAYSSMDDGSAPAPMTCSPGSGQIIIPELGDENQMERNTMVPS
ncbi:Rab5-bind domain-containing protein [Rhizoctonia solani AG-1 IA]|uniref:Rab5-bind domain-containing protein n=1 Tax=Thanatephorus cucumeris (strain AG1-IA) TaxID=983506 RepID=L8WU15_THACA|nr:Rab5-bind domain-containing protein [Rhizoctonia solani AG-1 IA]